MTISYFYSRGIGVQIRGKFPRKSIFLRENTGVRSQ
nr:MAG TPA: hypothetical protein [Caudoviricetes sp.]